MTTPEFPHLFSPIRIGPVEIKNRIALAPVATGYATEFGAVTEQLKAYYARRAQGGAGLLIVEGSYVDAAARLLVSAVGIYDDWLIPGHRELTSAVHAQGARVLVQLAHPGAQTHTYIARGRLVAPSAIASGRGTEAEIPQELSVQEIQGVVEAFAEAARRAKEAGYDGVEIQACHGYLLSEFLSPYYNHRQDAYGGSLENRARIIVEVIQRSRKKVGEDFAITARVNGEETLAGGLTREDSLQADRMFQQAGIDALHVSIIAPGRIIGQQIPRGGLVPLAEAAKKVVTIPVITVGSISNPRLAEQVLREGKADMVAMGRPLLADPDLPNKAMAGQLDDIRECIVCGSCQQREIRPQVNCLQNFETGRESVEELKIKPAPRPKRVMVIGGGPGGMEAARVAALRGHQVTLYEKEKELGGQMRLAIVAPFKSNLKPAVTWLSRQVGKLGVEVKLGTMVTPELVEKEKPDVVIVATGSTPRIAHYPMVEQRNELPNLVTAHDVLAGKAQVGKYVLVVGSGVTAAEAAEVLAGQGKGVTLITRSGGIGKGMHGGLRGQLINRLQGANVLIYPSTRVNRIVGKQVYLDRDVPMFDARVKLNQQVMYGVDTVVFGIGSTPNNSLVAPVKERVAEVYVIGDAVETRTALYAIHEGSRVARLI